jgi:hypothetical protein
MAARPIIGQFREPKLLAAESDALWTLEAGALDRATAPWFMIQPNTQPFASAFSRSCPDLRGSIRPFGPKSPVG